MRAFDCLPLLAILLIATKITSANDPNAGKCVFTPFMFCLGINIVPTTTLHICCTGNERLDKPNKNTNQAQS